MAPYIVSSEPLRKYTAETLRAGRFMAAVVVFSKAIKNRFGSVIIRSRALSLRPDSFAYVGDGSFNASTNEVVRKMCQMRQPSHATRVAKTSDLPTINEALESCGFVKQLGQAIFISEIVMPAYGTPASCCCRLTSRYKCRCVATFLKWRAMAFECLSAGLSCCVYIGCDQPWSRVTQPLADPLKPSASPVAAQWAAASRRSRRCQA
ncbi:hypothetical protein ABH944_004951 [Caballeronia udeis]|uniref:Uncharacterized protein n=1 Tax=Caballeronia udeis TaxID=1232866 RepID=A0ABW8MMP0_9BURK